jgi:hypothetical protein
LGQVYYNHNAHDIIQSFESSFLEDYDEDSARIAFRDAMAVSAAYGILSRCGIDPDEYYSDEDFMPIFDINTSKSIHELGAAVSTVSEQVLREIEVTIKKYERQKAAERSENYGDVDVQRERGLYDTQSDTEGTAGRTDRQVRQYEKNVSDEPPQGAVQPHGIDGTVISSFTGDRPNGEQTAGAVNERTDGEQPATGQRSGSDGMGSPHELPESASGSVMLLKVQLISTQKHRQYRHLRHKWTDPITLKGMIL